jgi:DNA mismatch repair protein MutS2
VDDHSLTLLEFDRVTAAVAAFAESDAAGAALAAWRPLADPRERGEACACLHEALRRHAEPGAWCHVSAGTLAACLDPERGVLAEGPVLVEVRGWLDAGHATRAAWADPALRARHARLAALADGIPPLDALREALARALEPDGRVSDGASPRLRRARRAVEDGERDLQHRLERWARGFGEQTYVTRHGDRFVALVPAAGFPRRRALVHDVSGSGQSLFVEPLEVCEANNHVIEQRAAASEEERRVLVELADAVRAQAGALAALERALVALDTLRARARWAAEVGATAVTPGGDRLALRGARHPLLAMGARRAEVVPLDLELAPEGRLLLVSGPNMGGKTVLLKTVGLAVLLAHAAFPVPAAEGSAVPEFDTVRADLGDEQSVDLGLSTFAAHLRALAAMAEEAGPRALLLCDELGAGTDPEAGAALGRALVEHFAARGAWGVMTTHLGSLKRLAGEVARVVNGSLEFDAERLVSRYRFVPGVPGASWALAVAESLGFPRTVVERARVLTPDEARALERLLADVAAARAAAEVEAAALRAARAEATAAAAEHRAAAADARERLKDLRRRLTGESEAVLAQARELWQTIQREARRAERSRAGAEAMRERLAAVEGGLEALDRAARAAAPEEPPAPPARVEAGTRVRVPELGIEAEVVAGPDAEGRLELRRGGWTIHSHLSKVVAAAAPARTAVAATATWSGAEAPAPLEVDLRGLEADEALRVLDGGLDRAVLAGLGEVRIIHGVGRGVLRAAVERHLRGHPQIAAQRLGQVGEGGRGVTVARLR